MYSEYIILFLNTHYWMAVEQIQNVTKEIADWAHGKVEHWSANISK